MLAMQITRNFSAHEFRCLCKDRGLDVDDTWCHGQVWVHRELVEKLQELRDLLNKDAPEGTEYPVIIESGCRCPAYNSVGLEKQGYKRGARYSQHIRGTAADIKVKGKKPSEVAKVAKELGFYVIEYPTFVHVDIRDTVYN